MSGSCNVDDSEGGCSSGYHCNGGDCVSNSVPVCTEGGLSYDSVTIGSSGTLLTTSQCTDDSSPISHKITVDVGNDGTIEETLEGDVDSGSSFSATWTPSCNSDDGKIVRFRYTATDSDDLTYTDNTLYTSHVCCDDNKEWFESNERCVYKITGEDAQCTDIRDCNADSYCSDEHCCETGTAWNGNECSVLSGLNENEETCVNARGSWLSYMPSWRWESGTGRFCAVTSENEYHIVASGDFESLDSTQMLIDQSDFQCETSESAGLCSVNHDLCCK